MRECLTIELFSLFKNFSRAQTLGSCDHFYFWDELLLAHTTGLRGAAGEDHDHGQLGNRYENNLNLIHTICEVLG